MSDVALVPISWIRTVAFAGALAIVGVFFLGRCSAPTPPGLPPDVQAAVTRHEILTVQDTARERQLLEQRDRARHRELVAAAAGRLSDSVAAAKGRAADSLAAIARAAQTSADSAEAWRIAYEVRSTEVRDVEYSRDSARAETREAKVQLAAADSIAGIWKTHALRGDSLITVLVPIAQRAGDECRILRFFACPSRKTAAVAAAAVTAGAIYVGRKVAKGEIRVRLPIG
jgi:hypothetical protein